jgi:transcriptional regulator with PAS, ATPase and Fis domain
LNHHVTTIEDRGSLNGTRVNGIALTAGKQQRLHVSDGCEVGAILLTLQMRASSRQSPASISAVAASAFERIAKSDISVLVLGETGVGKEILTRRLHQLSNRAARPLLTLNCAALTQSLIESELFGHEKGAFTGATATKPGLLESAESGTIFLDEIGEMPLPTQSKLLRVIEQQEILRVGAVHSRKIDVRFMAATNRDLEADIDRGTFRRDLFFRLAGAILRVPPLRERTSEIVGFAREFLAHATSVGNPVPELSPSAMCWLERQPWPGNLRELRNTIERAALLCDRGVIEPEHLSSRFVPHERCGRTDATKSERLLVLDALTRVGGNQSFAARELGISRNTLIARLEKYGLTRPRKHHRATSHED